MPADQAASPADQAGQHWNQARHPADASGSPADASGRAAGRAGQPAEADRAALAASALDRAKSDAAARGSHPAPAADSFSKRNFSSASPAAKPRSRRERRDDPAPLAAAIDGLITETGWELAVAAGSVFGRWAQIVGADLAAHTSPDGLADGELTVTADSTAWATQLRLLAADLVRRLNAELGDGAVRRVKVRGPAAAPRRPGEWRVRGSRGPRDTYG
jgi:predicted nucleic acid-binding Zn ribbon protein